MSESLFRPVVSGGWSRQHAGRQTDLPKMTEDLWYHALKFLDKYRTDVRNYDIEELYQFTDHTGILDRHRQLLFKPFQDSQVDMKIMYYELIKMLIDYERRNQPDTFDATKTVGKIEGYQELTNKLQRYLNQRFIVDIDQITKTQTTINQVFGGDVAGANILQRLEILEEKMGKLEKTNQSLLEEIGALKEKDKEISENVININTEQKEFESRQKELIQITDDTFTSKHVELESRLTSFGEVTNKMDGRINFNEKDCKRIEINLTNLYNQQKEDIYEKISDEISTLTSTVNQINEENVTMDKRVSEDAERIDRLEKVGPEITKTLVSDVEQKFTLYQTTNDSKIKLIEGQINENELGIGRNQEEVSRSSQEISNILEVQNLINVQLTTFNNKSDETWKYVDDAIANQNVAVTEIQNLVELNSSKMKQTGLETVGQFSSLTENVDNIKKATDINTNILKEHGSKLSKHEEIFESLDSDFENEKDRLRKIVDNEEVINKSLATFESRHVETVERMKEVTVLANSIQISVQKQEQRFEQQKTEDFNQFNNQMIEMKKQQQEYMSKLVEIDEDNQTLIEKINGVEKNTDSRLKDLDEIDKELLSKISESVVDNGGRFLTLNNGVQEQQEKIKQLENAYHTQIEKALYMETLGNRMNQIEESRQQSDARVKEEVDATLVRNQTSLENDKQELLQKILVIENLVQTANQSSDTKNELLKIEIDQLVRKLKTYEETLQQLNDGTKDSSKAIGDIKTDLFNKITEIEDDKKKLLSRIQENENLAKENLAKVIKIGEESQIQKTQHTEALAKKEQDIEEKRSQDITKITENNMNILTELKTNLEKQIQEITIMQNTNLQAQRSEVNQSIQTFESNIKTMNNTVINMNQETFALREKMDKDLQDSSFDFKKEISENMTSLFASLGAEVHGSLSKNDEKLVEAEGHVKNLRELNGKLIEQVKENLSAHGIQQENLVDNLKKDNEEFLAKFQGEIEKEVSSLTKVASSNADSVAMLSKEFTTLSQKVIYLEEETKWKDDRDNVIENIQQNKNASNLNKESLEKCKILIDELDVRHKETLERMKEVTQLVNEYELKMKEIGQVFKEDQRKELKGIENQLNTIYTEYEKIEKELSDIKKSDVSQDELNKTHNEDMMKMKDELDGKYAEIVVQAGEQANMITNTDSKIMKIMEQANTLMVNDAKEMEKISSLEQNLKGLDSKLTDLEAADVFLQESYRQATEKTIALESQSKRAEDTLTSLYKEQQEDIEGKLKAQIGILLKDVEGIINEKDQLMITFTEQKENVEKRIGGLEESVNGFEMAISDTKKDAQDMNERMVSIQFQAEKAQYVEALTSRVNKIDESRQMSEEKNKEDFENLLKNNSQQLAELLKTLEDLQKVFEAEKNLNKTQCDGFINQVGDLEKQIKEKITMIISQTEEHKQLIEKSSSSISVFSEKIMSFEKVQENLTETVSNNTSEEVEKLRGIMEERVIGVETRMEDQGAKLSTLEARIEGNSGQTERMMEDLVQHNCDINDLRQTLIDETELVVKSVAEQQSGVTSLEERFERMETAQIYETKQFELIKERTDQFDKLNERVNSIEEFGQEQTSLILAVEKTMSEKHDEMDIDFRGNFETSREELRKIRTEITNDKENFWTLIVEIYSAFRGSTVVLKSEGVVKAEQADVLGVYRMVDSYNDRPVYKQEGGENYIYYSSASCSWLVGTVIGHQYGWLRNQSDSAAASRWLPDLSSGWEYRPLLRDTGSVELAGVSESSSLNSWKSDDGTLRIESLRDIEKVNEVIRDIRNSREID